MKNVFNNTRLNTDELKSLIPHYIKELNNDFDQINFKEKNYRDNSELFHKMRGTALSYGISDLVELLYDRQKNKNFEIELKSLVERINLNAKDF